MKIAFLTSGGIAPCLSASIGRLTENYLKKNSDIEIIGYLNGYKGLLLGNVIPLPKSLLKNIDNFYQFGGSPIGNSRVKLTNIFKKNKIQYGFHYPKSINQLECFKNYFKGKKFDNAEKLALGIKNAGAIFLGRYTPEAVGDYIAGPNHVLPTDRTARFTSGLNLLDYFKRSSVVSCTEKSIIKIGNDAINIANEEGLQAHALSIECRIKK